MAEPGAATLPNDAERALYLAVLEQGGRVLFRDVAEADAGHVLRLLELGLLIHQTYDASLGALRERQGSAPVHEQVGQVLAQGLTQRAIAGRMGLSERTVAGHISRLRDFYDAETLYQLGWLMRGGQGG